MNIFRKYGFPRLLMPSSLGLPPVEYCCGTSPVMTVIRRPASSAASQSRVAGKIWIIYELRPVGGLRVTRSLNYGHSLKRLAFQRLAGMKFSSEIGGR